MVYPSSPWPSWLGPARLDKVSGRRSRTPMVSACRKIRAKYGEYQVLATWPHSRDAPLRAVVHGGNTMNKICIAIVIACAPAASFAGDISYNLCNKYGVGDVLVLAKDKNNNMKVVYSGSVAKEGCVSASSSTGSGDHANIVLKIDQGVPYGVPWIKAGDDVNF